METIKYFISDIFCIEDIKNVIEIFDLEKNCLIYDNIYKHERIKQILTTNMIFNSLFNINCPSILLKEFADKQDQDIFNYILKNTYVQYIINNDSLKKLYNNVNNFKEYIRNPIKSKQELCKFIEKRHGISLNLKNESLCKSFEECILKKYDMNVSNYFKTEIEKIVKDNLLNFNNLNASINTNIVPRKVFKTILSRDCVAYNILHDCCFARMLYDNIVIHINSLDKKDKLIKYIEYICKKNEKQPVVIAPQYIMDILNKDDIYQKYHTVQFICEDFYMDLIPINWIKCFITTSKINTNLGKINFIISDDEINLSQQNLFQLTECISNKVKAFYIPNNEELIEAMFNLIASVSILQLNGFDKINKYVKNRNINLEQVISKINQDADNCILIADNRPNIMNIISLMITLSNLNEHSWAVIFMGSNNSIEYMKKILGNKIGYIHENRFEKQKFGIEIYNEILKDSKTWGSLEKYNKCLIIQDDSAIIKKGLEKSLFMYDDYVGPVWADQDYNNEIKIKCGNLCGNGGLSLRTIKYMKIITEQFSQYKNELFNKNLQTIPEDVFFAKYIKQVGGKVPSYERAMLFGCEQVPCNEAYGYHKVWNYTSPDFVNSFII